MTATITLADGGVLDVARWPLPAGVEDGVVNRSQLALAFSVSENTITKWLTQGLPVLTAGQNGVAYEFKLSHCWAWKQSRDDKARAEKARGDQLAVQAALAFRNLDDDQAADEGELTADELRKWSEAEYHRNRVAEQRGSLLRADRAQALMEDVLVAFNTAVTTLPDFAEMEFGLTAPQVQKLQLRCDDILKTARDEIERALSMTGQVVQMRGLGDQAELGL